ncbi:MAG: tripartite tricarboxylate transporter substrate binding protein [Gammaproteobacteria bacterium]|jgi:tripartite-type tricarboxylate transporter receptor subunit TctC|nr:tripartite tricarboxylate transporter substrate binding protein [Gammaproteobacteria bacterium]MBU1504430.1 tripartite tricarboxylate transporter substrate binding protein [Gammaproteobacteria bacterium]MBU2118968.1 tripartite tricarboxylate transporter substrate binding protein [Gammaproteobacteria bacterium]MBU2171809.1 tripartite tricarboxylate transporter substrate binding protein [Gammaproteobacteria bacterium]MBU2201188.1 tripartite tricarboxylate transporter substrate binding protein 
MIQRRHLLIALSPGLAVLHSADARAQSAPIRILVGAPAGGSTDTLARTLSIELGRLLGRTVIVENRPGAGGNIAADAVAKAPPDGNTLLMSFTSHAINASLYKTLPFDPIKDFTPLTCVATSPSVLVANPSLPAKDVRELIALAKAQPGKLNFAIGAVGSSLHLAGDAFKMQSGAYIVNIPYRGTAPALQDVLAGQVDLMFAAVGNAQAQIRAGKLKALGVTSAKRLPAFPDVPAIAEVLPGYESSAWFGLFGPGQMNPELAKRISDAARQAIATPDVKKRLEHEGAVPVGNSPEEFARFVQAEIPRWAKVVQFSGAKPE